MSTCVLSIEEHFEWMLCYLATLENIIELSASPGLLPQFDQPSDFRAYLTRTTHNIHAHAKAVRAVLSADVLLEEAPWA